MVEWNCEKHGKTETVHGGGPFLSFESACLECWKEFILEQKGSLKSVKRKLPDCPACHKEMEIVSSNGGSLWFVSCENKECKIDVQTQEYSEKERAVYEIEKAFGIEKVFGKEA